MSLVEADLWEIPVQEREDGCGCSESHSPNLQRRAEDKRAILEGHSFTLLFLATIQAEPQFIIQTVVCRTSKSQRILKLSAH